jgi:hypothetical protein
LTHKACEFSAAAARGRLPRPPPNGATLEMMREATRAARPLLYPILPEERRWRAS